MVAFRLLIVGFLMSGCNNVVYTNCPPIIQYDPAFNRQLGEELAAQPDNSALVRAVIDYTALRDELRACVI